jgi:uncharacterized membrane protein HdeD (DUF308 family)
MTSAEHPVASLLAAAARPDPLDYEQQHQFLVHLEAAARSADPAEQRGAREAIARFGGRRDIYADVERALGRLRTLEREPVVLAGTIGDVTAMLRGESTIRAKGLSVIWTSILAAGVGTIVVVVAALAYTAPTHQFFLNIVGLCLLIASITQALFGFAVRRRVDDVRILALNLAAAVLMLGAVGLVVVEKPLGGPTSSIAVDIAVAFTLRGAALAVTAAAARDLPERNVYMGLGVAHLVEAAIMLAMLTEPADRMYVDQLVDMTALGFLMLGIIHIAAAVAIRKRA